MAAAAAAAAFLKGKCGRSALPSDMADKARAEERKRVGNEAFAKHKLEAAIEAYSEAICFAPNEPVYYTNRAMCHRKKEHWEQVKSDCRHALQIDDTSIKGHYLLGVALDATREYAEAVQQLWRALELWASRLAPAVGRRWPGSPLPEVAAAPRPR